MIHHIPQQITSFVGRNQEISEVVNHLTNPHCRLLTLKGFGGIGKTRLASAVASHLSENHKRVYKEIFADGIYFVDLAPLTSSNLLATTIMDRLGKPVSGTTSPDEQLLNYLTEKKLLLILDNFEHIMDGHRLVSRILDRAPHVKTLITSRIRLNLPEETVYVVSGMTVPTTDNTQDIESYSALLLFRQIAQRVDWRFKLDTVQTPHVIRICRLVDGIPLAIEMAAAWVRILSCREIAGDLTRNLELLEATLGHVPERHRSIRVVFEYSWNMLTGAERQVFQKMSVFRGGCLRDAVEQITGAKRDVLLSLVDKSLLQYDMNERYQVHELLRQLAEEKLSENAQNAHRTHDSHGNYYADFLYERKAELTIYEHNSPGIRQIKADMDNVRVMWERAIAHQKFKIIDRAADSLFHHHVIQDTYREAADSFQKAVAMVSASDSFPDKDKLHS